MTITISSTILSMMVYRVCMDDCRNIVSLNRFDIKSNLNRS